MSVSDEEGSKEFMYVLEEISQKLDQVIGNEYGEISRRWEELDDAFEAEFNNKTTFHGVNEYDVAVDIASGLLSPPIILYALGFNGSCLLELYGLLERLAIKASTNALSADSPKREIIDKLLRRKSLNDIKRVLIDMGIWNKSDSQFLNEFTKKRDGTAHKNPDEISKVIPGEWEHHLLDMNSAVRDVDTPAYIARSIRLMLKLFYNNV